jgi:hypothetical protein
MSNDVIARGLAKKKAMEEEKKKKQSQPGFFDNVRGILRGVFSGDNDPSKRGAARTSPEALKREEEARKKREEEKKKRGY